MVKYVVRLNPEEREQLRALVNAGRAAAVKLLHARILLKTDGDANERHWTDAEIAERAWRCWGLGRVRHLLDVHIGIPSLEDGA